jgi:hypothetical protein
MAHLHPRFIKAATALMFALLSACASPPRSDDAMPLLRLSPASLGATLAQQQQLTITVRGQAHRLDVLLEADPEAVRMAVVSLGQTATRLEWDGRQLTQTRAAWLPQAVTAERILADLQLMLWPADAVRGALPPGWTLDSTPDLRVLSHDGRPVARVRYEAADTSELEHLLEGYRVRVESRNLQAAP